MSSRHSFLPSQYYIVNGSWPDFPTKGYGFDYPNDFWNSIGESVFKPKVDIVKIL